MLQTHKIALDPNNVQATQLAQHCGYARVAYNHVLADFKEGLANGEWYSHIELNKRFNSVKREQYEWCDELNQRAAHNAIYFNFQMQRQLSRRQKESSNWHKTKAKIAKLHYRITCIRQDAQHQATTAIVNGASRIGIESLNVVGMLKNHRLAKALSDASLSSFLTMLAYKAERIGVKIVEAETFYPSSKTCSACGATDKDLSLSDRTYHCSDCGHVQDRDLNAAINFRAVAVGHTET